ncbi:hypothetical protein Droror1_Dr00000418 [Drosera rotundifolia]
MATTAAAAATRRSLRQNPWRRGSSFRRWFTRTRNLVLLLVVVALAPPIFLHFKLRRFHQMQSEMCGWLIDPPLVCAHGGDSKNAFPNTMAAYRSALIFEADCMEIDASRSSDGVLFALHDRDLQRISGNHTSKVGHFSRKEITELVATHQLPAGLDNQEIPTIEDALLRISSSVRGIILDVKVGPPAYEKGLAEDILSVVKKTKCINCIVWSKSDTLVRELIRLSANMTVGYIVMKDPSTGITSSLFRIKRASVVGVYHPLINNELKSALHGRKKEVYAWTVDDEVSMKRMLYNRVDGIVTGDPALVQVVMRDIRTQCVQEGFSLP